MSSTSNFIYPPAPPSPADAENRKAVAAEIAYAKENPSRFVAGGAAIGVIGERFVLSNNCHILISPSFSNAYLHQFPKTMIDGIFVDKPGVYRISRGSQERPMRLVGVHREALALLPEAELLTLASDEKRFTHEQWEACTPAAPLPPGAVPKATTPQKKGK
jgi:hypothetical protein